MVRRMVLFIRVRYNIVWLLQKQDTYIFDFSEVLYTYLRLLRKHDIISYRGVKGLEGQQWLK